MSRIALYFPRWAKAMLYGNLLLSFSTGTVWFALHRWAQVDGEFGPEKHPLEPWLIKLHGASAFLVLIGFGYLLASHVQIGWRSKRNRKLGLALISTLVMIIITGYLLYYASGDGFREAVSWTHLALGLSLPVTLILHVWRGHRRDVKKHPLSKG
jgi:hypothetical protein